MVPVLAVILGLVPVSMASLVICLSRPARANTIPASNASLVFTPTDVSGTVIFWTPGSGRWIGVRSGSEIPEKTLVQVGPRSSLTLEVRSRTGSADSRGSVEANAPVEVKITSPMVFRVERDLVRKLSVNRKAFSVPVVQHETKAMILAIASDFANGYFRDAFRSVVSLIRWGEIGVITHGGEGDEDLVGAPSLARKSAGRIKVLYPAGGNRIFLEGFPSTVRLYWEFGEAVPEDDVQVFFWPAGELPGPPVAVTRDTTYNLLVTRPGEYNVQLATTKWNASSNVRRFFVQDARRLDSMSGKIRPVNPPADFVFATAKRPVRIPFLWEPPGPSLDNPEAGSGNFELVVAPDDKGPRREKVYPVESNSTVLTLNRRGRFVWYVREKSRNSRGGNDPVILQESLPLKFTITDPAEYAKSFESRNATDVVARHARSGRRAFIYLDQLP